MLNFALIGPGRMGIRYGQALLQHPKARLVAVCGRTEAKASALKDVFPGVSLYWNNEWQRMFDEHPEINSVIIATSEWAHVEPTLLAMKLGKHILLEKPLASSYEESQTIMRAAASIKTQLMVCHTSRFDARLSQAKSAIASGQFGKIGYFFCRRNADHRTAARVIGRFPMPFWITCHDIDLMRWISGADITEVQAFESGIGNEAGGFLHASLLLSNGTRGLIETNWMGPSQDGLHHSRLDIQAEKGRLEVNLTDLSVMSVKSDGRLNTFDTTDFVDVHGRWVGATPFMIDHFITTTIEGKKPSVTFEDGWKSIQVCHALDISLKEKRPVQLDSLPTIPRAT
jgi:predicted dehydrogenase